MTAFLSCSRMHFHMISTLRFGDFCNFLMLHGGHLVVGGWTCSRIFKVHPLFVHTLQVANYHKLNSGARALLYYEVMTLRNRYILQKIGFEVHFSI